MKKTMVCAVMATSLICLSDAFAAESKGAAKANGAVEHGRYLVMLGGCNECHTPKVFTPKGPQPDASRLLSGHPASEKLPPTPEGVIGPGKWGAVASAGLTAWVGPWGTSFAANLTPDATGIASWTPESFIKAMKTGKHLGEGRQILPPMPWPDIGRLSDGDLRAIFAYLKSLPAVANQVPGPVPPANAAK